jgi:eukaryotic-like serine/threonine-protein kinase
VTLIPSLGPVEVSVPNVTGQPLAQADQALRAAGLIPANPTQQASASIQAGVVISTNPVAYQLWPKDKPVQIVVSDGVPLPNFVGEQLQQAQQQAQQGGYSIQAEPAANSNQPPNTIVGQSPPAGSPITPNEVVSVQVSQGGQETAIPNVDGMHEHQAIQELTAAGFQVQVQGGGFGPGTVTSYSPTGQAPQGSTITIVVNFGL